MAGQGGVCGSSGTADIDCCPPVCNRTRPNRARPSASTRSQLMAPGPPVTSDLWTRGQQPRGDHSSVTRWTETIGGILRSGRFSLDTVKMGALNGMIFSYSIIVTCGFSYIVLGLICFRWAFTLANAPVDMVAAFYQSLAF